MSGLAYDLWVAEAKAVDIADYAISRHDLKLTRHKDTYVGPCPECGGEDRFVITSNHKKKVFQCRGCKKAKRKHAAGDVVTLVMFLDGCTFNKAVEELTGKPKPPPERKGKLGKIVAEYPYNNEKGELSFQVVRYEPKNFRQRRPNGKGGWIWDLKGVRLVPYRLPELLSAIKAGQPLLIVEGEKDVATAEKLGFTATCAPGGVGMGWRSEYDQHFANGDVIVIPDNDKDPEKGPAYARTIANHLIKVARRVRWLELPPEVKDLSAWHEKGGTRANLEVMIGGAPDYEINQPGSPEDGGHHEKRQLPSPQMPMAVARMFVAEQCTHEGALTLHHWRGGWWTWRRTHWFELEDRAARSMLYVYTETAFYLSDDEPTPWAPTRRKIADLLEALAAITILPVDLDHLLARWKGERQCRRRRE